MSRFWMDDSFVREQACKLSLKAIAVFMALSSHANTKGETFIGYRTIGREMGLSRNTVTAAIRELEVSQLVGRLGKGKQGVSHLKIQSVPNGVSDRPTPWDKRKVIKEVYKEGDSIHKMIQESSKGRVSAIKERLRETWGAPRN